MSCTSDDTICAFCGPVEKTFECANCFIVNGVTFCEECRREIKGNPACPRRPACPRCTDYCGECKKLCYRSELYPTRDWDVCSDCI